MAVASVPSVTYSNNGFRWRPEFSVIMEFWAIGGSIVAMVGRIYRYDNIVSVGQR
jgi:hypothetical protein